MTQTPPSRRPGGRSARIEQAVLAAAHEELAAKGWAGFAMTEVAKRAGVHVTTLYRRWESPEQLAFAVALAGAEVGLPVPDTGSLAGDLTRFLSLLDAYLDTPLGAALLAALTAGTPADEAVLERFWSARMAVAGAIITRAQTRGEIPATAQAEEAITLAIAPLYFERIMRRRRLSAERIGGIARAVTAALSSRRSP